MSQEKERLLKILRLSRQGVGGEAAAAENLLNKLLKQNGMTVSDLDDSEKIVDCNISYRTKNEKTLFIMTCYKVLGHSKFSTWHYRRGRNIGVSVTPAQAVEIKFLYERYRQAFLKEIDVLLEAFIHTNHIFGQREQREDRKLPTEEDFQRSMRVQAMAQGVERVKLHKAITKGANQ